MYVAGLRYVGSGDTVAAELLPISLLTEGNLDFDEFVSRGALPYWFRRVNGHVVSNYPVLPGVLNVPVYAAARIAGMDLYARRFSLSMLTSSGVAALSALFLFFALRRVASTTRQALLFALAYAFGTCVWSVASRGLYQHGPSVLFLSLALWLLVEGGRFVPWAGLALGLAVINRPTNVVIALALTAFLWKEERRRLSSFLALAAVPALFHLWYASRYWGSPFSLAQDVSPSNFSGNPVVGLAGLLVSPSRGLFVFSPIFLFALPAAIRPPRSRAGRLAPYLAAAVLGTLLLYSFWTIWWGGHSFGYRLLIELAPLLTLLLALSWPRVRRSPPALAALIVCALFSLYVQFLGAMVFPSGFNNNLDRDPRRLWRVRNSEIELSTRKLIRVALGGTPLARLVEAARGIPPPAPRWWTAERNDDSIPGWIDTPLEGDSVEGTLEISGWARSPRGDVDVRLSISPDELTPPVQRGSRADVQGARPELGDCSRAGWRVVLSHPPGGASEHVLLVELKDPAGRVRRLKSVRFRWRA